MNQDNRKGTTYKIAFTLIFFLLLFPLGCAKQYAIQVNLDSHNYFPDENITASGAVYLKKNPAPNETVSWVIKDPDTEIMSGTFQTDENGEFSVQIPVPPPQPQAYLIRFYAGDAQSRTIPFRVSNVADIIVELVNNPYVFPLRDISEEGITTNIPDAVGINVSKLWNESEAPCIVAQKDEYGEYSTIFGDDCPTVNLSDPDPLMYKYLEEGTVFKGPFGEDFMMIYIDPRGSTFVIAQVYPFAFSGGETVNILAIALNETGSPIANQPLSYEVFDAEGAVVEEEKELGTTSQYGVANTSYMINNTGGLYKIVVNGIGHVSYQVEKYELIIDVRTPEGDPVISFYPDQPFIFTATLLDLSTGKPVIGNPILEIEVTGPEYELVPETRSVTMVNGTFTNMSYAPSTPGKYSVEFTVKYGEHVQKMWIGFEVKEYDVFMFPVAIMKGPAHGFAPGEEGAIFISARYVEDGTFVPLANETQNCAESFLELKGIYDKEGKNWITPTTVNQTLNITHFFETLERPPPPWVVEDIKGHFGEYACVMTFWAPDRIGIYNLKMDVIIAGVDIEVYSMIGVQDIFVFAYPVSETGGFVRAVNPGGTVYLGIKAYDSLTGEVIDMQNITSASLVEVFAVAEDEIVTDKMLNESFNNNTSAGIAMLSFVANDGILGPHFVKLRVTANVIRDGEVIQTEAFGEGWFLEKLYEVWVHPPWERWFFGSDEPVYMIVEVYDTSGRNPISDIKVYLQEVRHAETWKRVDVTANMCITGDGGNCTLEIYPPAPGLWKSGGYEVEVRIVDKDDNEDYGWGWFEIRDFMFVAWPRNWEISLLQDIIFDVEVKEFDEKTELTADVKITKLIYFGTWEDWHPPIVVEGDTLAGPVKITGRGNITLPAGYVKKEGQYAAVLEALTGDGRKEITKAWFYARPFVIWVDDATGNCERRYGIMDEVNLSVRGFREIEKVDWKTCPPNVTGVPYDLSGAWVHSIRKEGMWDVDYKNKEELEAEPHNMTWDCSGDTCYVKFNLTGFEQGSYHLDIIANDSKGNRAMGWFWMKVEILRIAVPELIHRIVPETSTATNSTYFQLSEPCGSEKDRPKEPQNVTDCAFGEVRIVHRDIVDFHRGLYPSTFFLLDRNTSRLYINTTGENFTAITPNTTGENFTDAAGMRWKITKLDNVSNYVYVESLDGVVGYIDKPEYSLLFIVDQSLSKSGKFLFGDMLRDEEWLNVDLDGDGNYSWEESYLILLADTEKPGVYDEVLISNTTNMTAGVTGKEPITFGGQPIYLLNIRYKGGETANYYLLTFTSNLPGWPGRELGIFKPGSIVKVPIMVTQPRNKSLVIENATVNITSVTRFVAMEMKSYPPQGNTKNNTTSAGLAMLELNTSNLPTGRFFLELEVLDPVTKQLVKVDNPWENPKIEIRNFVVRGELGMIGNITGIREWSELVGNLQVIKSDEALLGVTHGMWCWYTVTGSDERCSWAYPPDLFRVGDWKYRYVYYDPWTGKILIDRTPDDDNPYDLPPLEYGTVPVGIGNRSSTPFPLTKTMENNATEWVVATNITAPPPVDNALYITVVEFGETKEDRYYNFTLHEVNMTTPRKANISIEMIPYNYYMAKQQWTNEGEKVPGTPFNLTKVTVSNVTLRWEFPAITFESAWKPVIGELQGKDKRMRIANLSSIGFSQYQLVLYNSPSVETLADYEEGWSGLVDTIMLTNAIDGTILGNYSIGEKIPQIEEKAVVRSEIWDENVYLSNATLNKSIVYPLPWFCDAPIFYIAEFTEKSANVDANEDRELTTDTYYILFWDSLCDKYSQVTEAVLDDDTVMDFGWKKIKKEREPWDFDHPEEGFPDPWTKYNREERWISVGGRSWPFSITSGTDDIAEGFAKTFAWKHWIEQGESLTLWVTASYFNGTLIDGNVSTEKVATMVFDCEKGVMVEKDVTKNVSTATVPIINGTAFLDLDLSKEEPGDYLARFKVTEDSKYEILELHFWIEGPMKKCPPPAGPAPVPGGEEE